MLWFCSFYLQIVKITRNISSSFLPSTQVLELFSYLWDACGACEVQLWTYASCWSCDGTSQVLLWIMEFIGPGTGWRLSLSTTIKQSELWYYICWFADGDYASFFFLKPLAKFEWFIETGKSFSNFTQELSWCVELQRECNLNIHFYARRLLYFVWTPVKNSFTYTVYTDNFNI